MKVGILTLGCKVNMYESEYVINELKKAGYIICDFNDYCDVYIINTCSVTNTSDIKSRKMIRNAIRRNPNSCIVAMGCFIEANKDYTTDGLDIVIGNKDKSKIVSILDNYFKKKEEMRILYKDEYTKFEDMYITDFPGRTRAFVKIQDGCENFCSYCIIPYVRGKCRSKDKDRVIKEINSLVNNGYKEVVLTGIHTGNYGVDINTNFYELLKEIVKIKNLKRLRISSIEITEINSEVISLIKDNNIIVDHMHIPLQAGSNEILKLMNRKYDLDYYFKKIAEIRRVRPNISITTDVIVGFPGETDELFKKTIDTCKKLEFAKIHVFPFSLRKGTKAEELPNHIENGLKKKRSRELLEISKELEIKYFNKFVNKEVEILVEEYKDGYSYGHTSNFLHVKIANKLKHNEFYKVKIINIDYPYCIGEII